jgi:hypothetical protein
MTSINQPHRYRDIKTGDAAPSLGRPVAAVAIIDGDTRITFADGSTLLLKGVTQVDLRLFR